MEDHTMYVGIDVDDKLFHGSGISEETGETVEFACKPQIGALVKKLNKIREEGYELKVCYEAGYLGFHLCRDLKKHKVFCEIVAPSLIPRSPGKKVKTDKIDSRKLAKFYSKGLLTPIHVPEAEEEAVRDLIRSRQFISEQRTRLKLYITSLCRRHGLDYRSESQENAQYWTLTHRRWLKSEIKKVEYESLKITLNHLLDQVDQMEAQIEMYDVEVQKWSKHTRYQKKVEALCCYRGIGELTAMTLITELGDIKRFPHPKQLTSYAGMDITEYSSGGKERKYGITKMGNRRIRRAVIEASQYALRPCQISRRLKSVREGIDPKLIEISDRCMRRLYKKSTRLLYAGKQRNKVKVAAAREMLGFIWESLKAVA